MRATVLALAMALAPCLMISMEMETGKVKAMTRHSRVTLNAWDGSPMLITDATDGENGETAGWLGLSAWQNVSSLLGSLAGLPCAHRFDPLNDENFVNRSVGHDLEQDADLFTEDTVRGRTGLISMVEDCKATRSSLKDLGYISHPYFIGPLRCGKTDWHCGALDCIRLGWSG